MAANVIPAWSGTLQCLVATLALLNAMGFMTQQAVSRIPRVMARRLKQHTVKAREQC
jgi:hypothetical protein